MSDLKPCPFCGGDAIVRREDGRKYQVQCLECSCGTSLRYETDSYAIAAWNRRPELAGPQRASEVDSFRAGVREGHAQAAEWVKTFGESTPAPDYRKAVDSLNELTDVDLKGGDAYAREQPAEHKASPGVTAGASAPASGLVERLEKGEWEHSYRQGPNDTGFAQDGTADARAAAAKIRRQQQSFDNLMADYQKQGRELREKIRQTEEWRAGWEQRAKDFANDLTEMRAARDQQAAKIRRLTEALDQAEAYRDEYLAIAESRIAQINEANARAEQLERELALCRRQNAEARGNRDMWKEDAADAQAARAASEARVKVLEAALKPFVAEIERRAHLVHGPDLDDWNIGGNALTYGDLRRARAIMEKPDA